MTIFEKKKAFVLKIATPCNKQHNQENKKKEKKRILRINNRYQKK